MNKLKNQKTILALDLGTTTGWAIHNQDCSITSGTIDFKTGRFAGGGIVFVQFREWLVEFKNAKGGFDKVYFEEVRSHKGIDAAHKYGGFLATLTSFCEHHQIPYLGVPVGTIKKHITGKGNTTKYAVIDAIKKKGFEPIDDNEADSLALLDYTRVSYSKSRCIADKQWVTGILIILFLL